MSPKISTEMFLFFDEHQTKISVVSLKRIQKCPHKWQCCHVARLSFTRKHIFSFILFSAKYSDRYHKSSRWDLLRLSTIWETKTLIAFEPLKPSKSTSIVFIRESSSRATCYVYTDKTIIGNRFFLLQSTDCRGFPYFRWHKASEGRLNNYKGKPSSNGVGCWCANKRDNVVNRYIQVTECKKH